MTKEFNITQDSLTAYMRQNHSTKAVVGETADSFLVQRGNQIQQVRKADVEAFGIREGILDVGLDRHRSNNAGMRESEVTGKLKSQGKTLSQVQDRYNNDPVYQAALNAMPSSEREKFRKVMENASNEQRMQYVRNVRDNYADAKYADVQYQSSSQAEIDRMAQSDESVGLPYGEGVKVHRNGTAQ